MARKFIGAKRTPNLKAVEAMGLPTPRLQFRWEPIDPPRDGYNWRCHYELVLKLDKYDIRNPSEYKKDSEMMVALGGCMRGSERGPVMEGKADYPFRDGAHAYWDGKALGCPPVYSICGDTVTHYPDWYTSRDAIGATTSTTAKT